MRTSTSLRPQKHPRILLTAVWCLMLAALPAQAGTLAESSESHADTSAYLFSAGVTATASSGQFAPMWLTANRHGLSSTLPNSIYLQATALRRYSQQRGFNYEWGIDLAAASGFTSAAIIHQLYGGVRYNCWQLSVGSREHFAEGRNPLLSTGGMTWSGNARPVPQVRFGIFDYTPISFLLPEWLSVKGFLSYGRLTDGAFQRSFVSTSPYSAYNRGALLHEKSAFLRIGNAHVAPLSVELGVEMDCMFGGELWYHNAAESPTDYLAFVSPTRPADFLRAFIPMNGGEGTTNSDQHNAEGNHFGSYHAAVDWKGDDWQVRGYYEHYFESRCGMTPWNGTYDSQGVHHNWIAYPWFDALYGLELTLPRNPIVSTIVLEYNTTRDQCGSIHHSSTPNVPARIYGQAFYYYNSSYPAWQHWGMTAGYPFMYGPLYNADHAMLITDARIRTFHAGILGQPTSSVGYRLLATYVRTWGSYIDPLPAPAYTFSSLAEATWQPARLPGWQGTLGIALDHGTRFSDSLGMQLAIKKTF